MSSYLECAALPTADGLGQGALSGPVPQERLVTAGASAGIGEKLECTEQGCSAQNVLLCHFASPPVFVHRFTQGTTGLHISMCYAAYSYSV